MKGVSVLLPCAILEGCSLASHQSASECEAKLLPATQGHVADMLLSEILGHDARSQNIEEEGVIAHELWGDKPKFPSLQRILETRGFKTSIEPEEYGDHLRIDEPVDSFRRHAPDRIRQLCKLGEQMHLRYNGWPYTGPHTDYVMQWMAHSRSFAVGLLLSAALALSACATPAQMHSEVQLNAVALGCGLALGELIQDEAQKKLLLLVHNNPTTRQRVCIYEWARKNGLKAVFVNMDVPS